jgi:hypothetical protein
MKTATITCKFGSLPADIHQSLLDLGWKQHPRIGWCSFGMAYLTDTDHETGFAIAHETGVVLNKIPIDDAQKLFSQPWYLSHKIIQKDD